MPSEVADAFLNRPRALRMVVSLAQHGALSATEFSEEAEYVPEAAKKLRDELEAWGLVHVEEVTQNNAAALRITPTPPARRVAEVARDLKEVIDRDRAIKALRAIDARGPLTTRQLAEATGYVPDRAKRLREDLDRLGLVTVEAATVNAALAHRIALTPKGRRAVEAAQEVGRIVERTAAKAGGA